MMNRVIEPGTMRKRRIFVDMDGVMADFARLMIESGKTGEELKRMPGAFRSLKPIPGALEAIRSLIGRGFDVFAATKPVTGQPICYAEKVEWILDNVCELKRKIILTHDKGLLGAPGDVLVDDRPHKANCAQFLGHVIVFDVISHNWTHVLPTLMALDVEIPA